MLSQVLKLRIVDAQHSMSMSMRSSLPGLLNLLSDLLAFRPSPFELEGWWELDLLPSELWTTGSPIGRFGRDVVYVRYVQLVLNVL